MFYLLLGLLIFLVFCGKKISVATVFCLMWIFFIILAVLIYGFSMVSYKGVLYILSICLTFFLTNRMCNYLLSRRGNHSVEVTDNILIKNKCVNNSKYLFVIAYVAGVVGIINDIIKYGYSFGGIKQFLAISSVVRFTEYDSSVLILRLIIPYILSVLALDGYFTASKIVNKIEYKSRFLFLYLIIVFQGVMSTGKSVVIWGSIFWVSGILSGTISGTSETKNRELMWKWIKKNKKTLVLFSLSFLILMMSMMFFRKQGSVSEIWNNFIRYAFGQVPCFTNWFENVDKNDLQNSYGRQTIYGIVSELESLNNNKLYIKNISYNWPLNLNILKYGMRTNIYTAFRGVIEDFGIAGSYVFWFILGSISGCAESAIHRSKSSVQVFIIFTIYIFCLFSFIISAWHYASVVLAVMMFFVELILIKRIRFKLGIKIKLN